jgi:hypothetical protein
MKIPMTTAIILALAALPASADLITFHNTNALFEWSPQMSGSFPGPIPGTRLDITQPNTQSGDPNSPLGIGWYHAQPVTSSQGLPHFMFTGSSVRFVTSTVATPVQLSFSGPPTNLYLPQDFSGGAVIGPGLSYSQQAHIGYHWVQVGGDLWIAGSSFTLGVRITLPDGPHYGFARFQQVGNYIPMEWGYEDRPNVPISVPGPGSMPLLTAAALMRRRRR